MKKELKDLLTTKETLLRKFTHYINTVEGKQIMSELNRTIGLVMLVNYRQSR